MPTERIPSMTVMPSRFLPKDYDPSFPVAVIAGQRLYPILTVNALRKAQVPVRLIAFEGETERELVDSFPLSERVVLKVGQVGKTLKAIQQFEARYALMVGQISPRRLFRGLHPDVKAVRILAGLKERNAETIFGAVCQEIEALGARMLDARAFLDEHVAPFGLMTGGKLNLDFESMDHGIRIARQVAALDIGQGVVVRKGTVLAVEAFEGTDRMIERAGEFRTNDAIFVKTTKPCQDYRFDVPVFGTRTLETMKSAGVTLAALEAGTVLMLDREAVIQAARKARIQLYGYRVSHTDPLETSDVEATDFAI